MNRERVAVRLALIVTSIFSAIWSVTAKYPLPADLFAAAALAFALAGQTKYCAIALSIQTISFVYLEFSAFPSLLSGLDFIVFGGAAAFCGVQMMRKRDRVVGRVAVLLSVRLVLAGSALPVVFNYPY